MGNTRQAIDEIQHKSPDDRGDDTPKHIDIEPKVPRYVPGPTQLIVKQHHDQDKQYPLLGGIMTQVISRQNWKP